MILNSFEKYLELGKVKRKTPDIEEAVSLFNKSKSRLKYTDEKKIEAETASFVLEDSYEAIRECAQALMSVRGFKPYSHEATISFIKDFFSADFSEEEIRLFEYFRQLRCDSVYKAIQVEEADAKDALSLAKKFIEKVELLLNLQNKK